MITTNNAAECRRVCSLPPIVALLVLLSFTCCSTTDVVAQSAQQSDRFDGEFPPELASVAKAIAADDYDRALTLLSKLRAAAAKERNKALVEEIVQATKDVNRLKRAFARLRKFSETLKQKRDDPKANEAIGRFQCVDKGEWTTGLKLLVKAETPKLRQVARLDLKRPTTPATQEKLAERWWRFAATEKGNSRRRFQLRGRYWYLQARAELSAASRRTGQKQLSAIPLFADKIVIWNQHNGNASDRGAVECLVTLYYEGKSVWRQAIRLPWEPKSPAAQVLRPPHKRVDQIRVDVTTFRGKGGGLGEVEVFDGRVNIARRCSAVATGYWEKNPSFHPNRLTDGKRTGHTGIWLLNNDRKGWAAVDFVILRQQQ